VPEGLRRVRIESVTPEIDGGRYPIKRIVGDRVAVEVDLVVDGHDQLAGRLAFRHHEEEEWREVPLEPLGNDRWRASFEVKRIGRWLYTVCAWVDSFETWRHGFEKKVEDGQDVALELQEGSELVQRAADRASEDADRLERLARTFADRATAQATRAAHALADDLRQLMARYPDRSRQTVHRELGIIVDREQARFSTWYELFPRSWSTVPGGHGTFRDVIEKLPYVAGLGFDVLYFPPIHPIGTAHRKGKNNSEVCEPGEPGSPCAIGAKTGGHKSVHPELGTLDDFRALVSAAEKHGLEIALDIAFQCSPDHPYVKEHPAWFRWRPDGTVQYAENPPKKYQDIYPFDFDSDEYRSLWQELESVFEFWVGQGVRIFRVDNPHTKSLAFWEWAIGSLKAKHPDLIFLAEAFTRAHPQAGDHRVSGGADPIGGGGVLSAQLLAQHTRYPSPGVAGRRPPGVHDAVRARRHVVGGHRHIRARVRIVRERTAGAGGRGEPGQRKVRDPGVASRRGRQHC